MRLKYRAWARKTLVGYLVRRCGGSETLYLPGTSTPKSQVSRTVLHQQRKETFVAWKPSGPLSLRFVLADRVPVRHRPAALQADPQSQDQIRIYEVGELREVHRSPAPTHELVAWHSSQQGIRKNRLQPILKISSQGLSCIQLRQ